ncbi:MAG: ABC transporter permease [Gammaproteobacteria bacterium]|nr:ABC transporter permease [Gammaproteobacteria bacterium]
MYRLIAMHETRALARTWALWAILALLVFAIAFAAWSGGRSVSRQLKGAGDAASYEVGLRDRMRQETAEYEAKVKATGGPYEFATVRHAPGQGPPQGTNAGAVGAETAAYIALPPTGLAALSIGQSDIQLDYLPITMGKSLAMTANAELENPVNLLAGSFDVAFVVIFLLPIFILAMTYDLLSSERERGTLAMVLAHPVSLRKLMASKLMARAAIILLVVTGLGLVAVLAVGNYLETPETWLRFALWIIVTLVYSMFWFALAVLVNIYGQSSSTNGTILAGAWLILVVIIPTLISLVATTIYPVPSRMDLTVAAREAQTAAEKNMDKSLNAFYAEHLEYVPAGDQRAMDFMTLGQASANTIEKALSPLYAEFQARRGQQQGLVQRSQYLSPAVMMQLALNEISGTSSERYEDFLQQAAKFRTEWNDYFAERFLRQDPLRPADYDSFPAFRYQPEPFSVVLKRLAPSLSGLLILLLGVALVPLPGIRRYQVAAR